MDDPLSIEVIQNTLIEIQGQQVLLDSDVAHIYGVQTKRINEAVRNNPEKFPSDYLVKMGQEDWRRLKSKFSTSKRGGKVKTPMCFPEKGLYMLATILKSPRATQATFAIIETFAKFRDLSKTLHRIQSANDSIDKKSLMQESGRLVSELISDNLQPSESEFSLEVNFAVLKLKHSVKRSK